MFTFYIIIYKSFENTHLHEAQSVAEKPCVLFLRRSGPLKSHLLNLMEKHSLEGVIMNVRNTTAANKAYERMK